MDKGTEQTFIKKDTHTNGQQVYENVLNITNYQGNANQSHSEVLPHICQNSCNEEDKR